MNSRLAKHQQDMADALYQVSGTRVVRRLTD